ncbi:MAG: 7-cyano-7-deazaguanine synthase [Nanoarchaeota archaeon]|nr:7-cyano-7-deazaguanine synthase [Nanoarchaeota archaeon]
MLNHATQQDKEKMVKWAVEHGLPIQKTRSCYSDKKEHCGVCLSCRRRKETFKKSNVDDKTKYSN